MVVSGATVYSDAFRLKAHDDRLPPLEFCGAGVPVALWGLGLVGVRRLVASPGVLPDGAGFTSLFFF